MKQQTTEAIQVLPCKLTDAERMERGSQLAQTKQLMEEHDAHADAVRKELKAKETALLSDMSRLASIVRAGKEPREVRVQIVRDYKSREYLQIRADTLECVFRRPLREDEKQVLLDFEPVPLPRLVKPEKVFADVDEPTRDPVKPKERPRR